VKLGNKVQEFYQGTFGKVAMVGILTYLRRELAHAIWRLLLDNDLMLYSTNGKAINFFNKIMRAMFPRFLFYSGVSRVRKHDAYAGPWAAPNDDGGMGAKRDMTTQ